MDVSNSTGQNTDYRVASGGEAPPLFNKPGSKQGPLSRKLGPNSHHKDLPLPLGTSWHIQFFKARTQTLLAEAKVADSSCLVILMEPSKGKFSVKVSKPAKPVEPVKPRQPRSKPPGKKVVGSAAEPRVPMAG